jgi:hypothetical protein
MAGLFSSVAYSALSFVAIGLFSTGPVPLGTPQFQVKYDHQMTDKIENALRKFQNAQSCLEEGANGTRRAELVRMDWDKISNEADATVCSFRLLHGWGGVSEAAAWMEAQGFRTGEHFSSKKPHVETDGTLRVDGYWSIKDNGPKFPTTGFVRRALYASAYLTSIEATFDSEGKNLIYLRISNSSL